MPRLSKSIHNPPSRPIKIMQFGEGNFLRAFVDYIIQTANDKGVINSNVVVVQPLSCGRIAELVKQDGLYTLYMEGVQNGKIIKDHKLIDVLGDFINPYEEYDKFLQYAISPDLEIVVSNTTEAGIVFDPNDTDLDKCPNSYPGKLLSLLWTRYRHFNGDYKKGLVLVPCELIDYNGKELKSVLNKLAEKIGLGRDFYNWLNTANVFINTLVDRIVPGYPKDQVDELEKEMGYSDINLVMSEVFHLWVLESDELAEKKFPVDKCGLNVVYAHSVKPYKDRKVKILNGSHTALVPVAYLKGIETVGESLKNPELKAYLRKLIFDEIVPTIDLPADDKKAFAESVLERYSNPYIKHQLLSIALNSTTKFKTRLLPTLEDYIRIMKSEPPKTVLFALAALIEFYKGKRGEEDIPLSDDAKYLAMWKDVWTKYSGDYQRIVKTVLAWDVWGLDIASLHREIIKTTATYLENIDKNGMDKALTEFLAEK